MKRLLLAALLIHTTQAKPISFAETFVLADSPAAREAALATLIPGSEDALYYRALHLEHLDDWTALRDHLAAWRRTRSHTQKLDTCELRLALHTIDEPASLQKIRDAARPGPPHLPPASAATRKLPTSLDPTLVSATTFLKEALRTNNTNTLTHHGIRTLLASDLSRNLSVSHRHAILNHQALTPDIPGLYELIRTDLADKSQRRTFGKSPAHSLLTLDQLADLRRALPDLENQQEYVHTVIRKLRPPAILPIYGPPAARETRKAYLDAALKFALPLPPAFSSLKAHLLFHRLKVDESAGTRNRDRFLEYLALPRPTRYASKSYLSSNSGLPLASLSENFTATTGLRSIGNDAALIRTLLIHFLKDERSTKRFTKFFTEDHLRPLHAEARILAGKSQPEKFLEALSPAQFTALRDRIDLEFAPDAPTVFTPDDKVTLPLLIKNVPHIDVRIFELDPLAIYEANGKEIEPQIDLSGLAPTAEFRIDTATKSPFLQTRISPDLPPLLAPGKRGTWIIDVVGSGRSCRALVRKGQLLLTQVKSTPAGQELTITDASGKPVSPAAVRLSGSVFKSDEDTGKILLPYTTSAGKKPLVLVDPKDGFASLAEFDHAEETIHLNLEVLTTSSALIPGLTGTATIIPHLRIGSEPTSLDLCTELTLSISGSGTSLSIPLDPKKFPAPGASQHISFPVPPNADALVFEIAARIKKMSTGEIIDLDGSHQTNLASEFDSAAPSPFLIPASDSEYSLLLAGRNFEPYSGYPFSIEFSSTSGGKPRSHEFASDESGRVALGDLSGINSLEILGHRLEIEASQKIDYPDQIFTHAGSPISIPLLPRSADPILFYLASSEELARILTKYTDRDDDHLSIKGLEPGKYLLFTPTENEEPKSIKIHVSPKPGIPSHLSLPESPSPSLAFVKPKFSKNGDLTISLENTTPETQISFITSPFFASSKLPHPSRTNPHAFPIPILTSRFLSGRKLGGEERYVLDRRTLPTFAGSLAPLPGVLINPWVLAESQASAQTASDAVGWFDEKANELPMPARPAAPSHQRISNRQEAVSVFQKTTIGSHLASLRFLANPSKTASNLRADKNGTLIIPAAELGEDPIVTLFATDPSNGSSISLRLTREAKPPATRDLRLSEPLSEKPVSRKLTERIIPAGEKLTLPENLTSSPQLIFTVAEYIESLAASVPEIAPFRILGRWHTLDNATKQETYSRLASHELHLFLKNKDPEFFEKTVAPYLRNKLEKTFIDLYLLNENLHHFHSPEEFGRLNAAEQALLAQRSPNQRDSIHKSIKNDTTYRKSLTQHQGPGGHNIDLSINPEAGEFQGLINYGNPISSSGTNSLGNSTKIILTENSIQQPVFGKKKRQSPKVKRQNQSRLYQSIETTKQWAESNYFESPRQRISPGKLFNPGSFWVDLAQHDSETPFLSAKTGGITQNVHSAMLAVALNDLPFIKGNSPSIARYLADKTIVPAENPPLVLRQAILESNSDKALTSASPLVSSVKYSQLTVVTNSTYQTIQANITTQIPSGSIATAGPALQSYKIELGPFASKPLKTQFYFPKAGDFAAAPAHASNEEQHLGSSNGRAMKVLPEPPTPDPTSWQEIAASGSAANVIKYLERANLLKTDLSLAAWRAKADPEFFDQITDLLLKRHSYSDTIFRYALEHTPLRKPKLASYLQQRSLITNPLRPSIDSPLFKITPFSHHAGELEDFFPLVPSRAHTLDGTPTITNPAFHTYYHKLLDEMAALPQRTGRDNFVLSTALLAQRRIAEAMDRFQMIPVDDAVAGTIQFAYLRATLALHQADGEMARTVAARYSKHPVERWRERFNTILAHAGGTPDSGDTPEASQDAIAGELPSLAFTGLSLRHQNTSSATIHIHEMDVELLFSAAPFPDSDDAGKRFRTIRPTATMPLIFAEATGTEEVVLPKAFHGKNVHITVTSGPASATTTRLQNHFNIAVAPTYGRLQVTAGSKPLSKVYVKAYVRHADGTVRFHKDGNTDLRGKFDYATTTDLSTNNNPVTMYALLILSETHGAKILQVAPPTK